MSQHAAGHSFYFLEAGDITLGVKVPAVPAGRSNDTLQFN